MSRLVVLCKFAVKISILNIGLGLEHQIHIPEDTGQPPHILILQVAAIAKLMHCHRQAVLARVHKAGYIVLRLVKSILRIAHKGAVHIHLATGVNPTEVHEHIIRQLFFSQIKIPNIQTLRVLLVVNMGNVNF